VPEATFDTLLVVFIAAAITPVLARWLKGVPVPAVVLEIAAGVLIGPEVLGLASEDAVTKDLANFGLSLLIFLAGYEVNPARIRGRPLRFAAGGWLISLAAGLGIGALLARSGNVSALVVGLALTTTALGTLVPILRDAGVLGDRFGTHALAIGTIGEFAPIVAIALLLSGDNPGRTGLLLLAFVAVTLIVALLASRPRSPAAMRFLGESLHTTGQLPVRLAMLILVSLIWLTLEFGLDVLLGAFAAGMVIRLASSGEQASELGSKLEGIGFGFFIPIFFVMTGVTFDIEGLLADTQDLLLLPLFLILFFLVRGLPILLYRSELERPDLVPLAFVSATALPLVVVITEIGVSTGRMAPSLATALVGAGMLSVVLFPALALRLKARSTQRPPADTVTPP
jgi:Kef-type K+ transport system membrane component KefB